MVFAACWTFPANLGAHTCVYGCIIWRYSSSSSSSSRRTCGRSVCLRSSEEVCIGLSLRICNLRRPRTSTSLLPPFLLAILSSLVHFLRMSGDMLSCKDATSAHRRRFVLLAERIYRTSTAMTNGGTFPLGWTIFFEKISGILYANVGEINSPSSCIAERNGFRFLRRERELILNLFQLSQIDSLLLFSSACVFVN